MTLSGGNWTGDSTVALIVDDISSGSYTIDWQAADPQINHAPYLPTYAKLGPAALWPYPVGRASDSHPDAVAYGGSFAAPVSDAVESLMPKDLALGQVVPFEIVITANGDTSPENGNIAFTGEWLAKVTNGEDFGFDPTLGLIAAFVDYGDFGTIDPLNNATVIGFSWNRQGQGTNNDRTVATVNVGGLNNGDRVVVECWVVLKSTIAAGIGGNVQTTLAAANTVVAGGTNKAINTGNQTGPLLQAGDFFNSQIDPSITKSDSPDPVIAGLNLPIYHGTSAAVLQKGVSHIERTSLPIGGIGTHAVLTGHRGLPTADLFRRLGELGPGDIILIHTLDEILAYQVDAINVVLPSDVEELRAVPDRDLVTLITCDRIHAKINPGSGPVCGRSHPVPLSNPGQAVGPGCPGPPNRGDPGSADGDGAH